MDERRCEVCDGFKMHPPVSQCTHEQPCSADSHCPRNLELIKWTIETFCGDTVKVSNKAVDEQFRVVQETALTIVTVPLGPKRPGSTCSTPHPDLHHLKATLVTQRHRSQVDAHGCNSCGACFRFWADVDSAPLQPNSLGPRPSLGGPFSSPQGRS